VTVYGSAELKVVPDVVDISVGVEIRGKDLASTASEQNSRVTDAIAMIRKAGVDAKDIQTDFASITPKYSNSKNGRNFDYYIAKKGIAFTLKDVSKYDSLTVELIRAGVDDFESVNFRVTDMRKYRDQAREMAVVAAREKAVAFAAKLGQKIGKAFSIEEDGEPTFSSRINGLNMSSNSAVNVSRNYVGEVGGEGAGSPESSLVLGQIPIEAHVKVRFELQ
jgi:uncharacterized protein YggE